MLNLFDNYDQKNKYLFLKSIPIFFLHQSFFRQVVFVHTRKSTGIYGIIIGDAYKEYAADP